jgi:iron complex transport system permease protein
MWWVLLFGSLVVAVSAGLLLGAVSIGPGDLWRVLLDKVGISDGGGTQAESVLWAIRIPRVLAAVLVGAALGVAGAALQGVYRNPLADPYLLGISSAAGLGVILGIALTPAGAFPVLVALGGAATGAGYALLTRRISAATVDPARFVLVGVALGLALLAWTGIVVFRWDSPRLPTLTYWIFGSFAGVTWRTLVAATPFVLVALATMAFFTRSLDLLALGDREARLLGIGVDRIVTLILAAVGVAVGATVGLAGVIGFIGLLVPFVLRRAVGPANRQLFLASAIGGAAVMVGADVLARTLASPAEIPVGIITASVGGPFLVWLLMHHGRAPT